MAWVEVTSIVADVLSGHKRHDDIRSHAEKLAPDDLSLLGELVHDQVRTDLKFKAVPRLLECIEHALGRSDAHDDAHDDMMRDADAMMESHRMLLNTMRDLDQLTELHKTVLQGVGKVQMEYRDYMHVLVREAWTPKHTELIGKYLHWTLQIFKPRRDDTYQWWWMQATTPVSRCAALIGGCFEEVGVPDEEMLEQASDSEIRVMEEFPSIAVLMRKLGLATAWRDMVRQQLKLRIRARVEEACEDVFTEPVLAKLLAWVYSPVLTWLRLASGLPQISSAQMCGNQPLPPEELAWAEEAKLCVLFFIETFCDVRVSQTFDMVKDFPDSREALIDLKVGLTHVPVGQLTSHRLVNTLRDQFTKRLNIAGVETRRVILAYCKTVKAMQILDPRGVILNAVSKPINEYLHSRSDTVRCILASLTTEGGELQTELEDAVDHERGDENKEFVSRAQFGEFDLSASESEEEEGWTPEPIEMFADTAAHRKKRTDLIYLLVSIYGSKEMFINEYKEMLCERLFACRDYDVSWERHNLELLKTRFGENVLMNCNVMLQDVQDSRRINKSIHDRALPVKVVNSLPTPKRRGSSNNAAAAAAAAAAGSGGTDGSSSAAGSGARTRGGSRGATQEDKAGGGGNRRNRANPPASDGSAGSSFTIFPSRSPPGPATPRPEEVFVDDSFTIAQVHALMLSYTFWPTMLRKEEYPSMRLPKQLEGTLEEYAKLYSQVKHTRSLSWKRSRGTVELKMILRDRIVELEVSPLQTAIIFCFQDDELASAQHPTRKTITELSLAVEVPEDVVRKNLVHFIAKGLLHEVRTNVYEVLEEKSTHIDMVVEELDVETVEQTDSMDVEEREKMANFVCGMLTNYSSLSLSRISNYLQLYMSDPPYSQTEPQLKEFLHEMCNDGRLDLVNGQYAMIRGGAKPGQ